MTDKQIENLIDEAIEERRITLYDLIGGRFIDPDPDDKSCASHERARWNKFKSLSWADKLIELISEGKYNPKSVYHPIKISIQDLMGFWWNKCVNQEEMLALIFEDILSYFKDKMVPWEETEIDYSVDFSEIEMGEDGKEQAA